MADIDDGYDRYYTERLWQLLPAVYRTTDTDNYGVPGPLRELIGRIAAQAAITRRSIDRMWADQSPETCSDWVVPYIGDLLSVNLVPGLDAAGWRIDVAKTIHYRRRKGTVAVLEEIASDVTGWQARVVEGFHCLARSMHGLDPAVGLPQPASTVNGTTGLQDPQVVQQLVGRLTGTPAGGLADLRSAHAADLTGTAFSEYPVTADVRAGHGRTGWFDLQKLLVFLWRLTSFAVVAGTPVPLTNCPGQYVFDPTGRQIPLFLTPRQPVDDIDDWVPAREWEIPGPLTSGLLRALRDPGGTSPARAPYPDQVSPSYTVALVASGALQRIADDDLTLWPELGRFAVAASALPAGAAAQPTLRVGYQYGFAGMIGAGSYDRTLLSNPPPPVGTIAPVMGGAGLDPALGQLGVAAGQSQPAGTVVIGDSLTYAEAAAAPVTIGLALIQAAPQERPVIRLGPAGSAVQQGSASQSPSWIFVGAGPSSELTLDGLLISGGDIVLRGAFGLVRLTACTLDPGTPGKGSSAPFATSADGRPLAPTRLWIEADPAAPGGTGVAQLMVNNCILGPVRTRSGGTLGSVTVTDSIIQGLPQAATAELTSADVFDVQLLAKLLTAQADPVSAYVWGQLSAPTQVALPALTPGAAVPPSLVTDLNQVIDGPSIYDPDRFANVALPASTAALAEQVQDAGGTAGPATAMLNRELLEAAYPVPIGIAAFALPDASVELTRVTVLGRVAVHELSATDSIITGFACVQDGQAGSVRFSAWASASVLPQRYESAQIPEGAPLFTSSAFGDPGYCQLLDVADRLVVPSVQPGQLAGPGALGLRAILTTVPVTCGAQDGSEMGAFCSLLNPIRERGLLQKYAEYMPVGLEPVVIHVT